MISSQKTTFSSLTWDPNICKVTKVAQFYEHQSYDDYYVPLGNLYDCFEIVMVQQTLLVVLCLEHPMKDKRSGYLLTFSGPSIMEQSETYFITKTRKHYMCTLLTRFCFSVLYRIVDHFQRQSFVITYLLRERKLSAQISP